MKPRSLKQHRQSSVARPTPNSPSRRGGRTLLAAAGGAAYFATRGKVSIPFASGWAHPRVSAAYEDDEWGRRVSIPFASGWAHPRAWRPRRHTMKTRLNPLRVGVGAPSVAKSASLFTASYSVLFAHPGNQRLFFAWRGSVGIYENRHNSHRTNQLRQFRAPPAPRARIISSPHAIEDRLDNIEFPATDRFRAPIELSLAPTWNTVMRRGPGRAPHPSASASVRSSSMPSLRPGWRRRRPPGRTRRHRARPGPALCGARRSYIATDDVLHDVASSMASAASKRKGTGSARTLSAATGF